MSFEEKIKELNIKLPEPKDPVGAYIASKAVGNLLYISGQISTDENGDLIKGKLGKDLDVNQGYEAAKRCGLAIIAQLKKACDNDLLKVKSCVKLTGYVNSSDDFIDQPKVINGASDIIAKVFDIKSLHTRAAVSTNSLPLGVAVEVDAIFEINQY
jgi:enamine deaminase RidA (YjgF/YER057c/UK114 family)